MKRQLALFLVIVLCVTFFAENALIPIPTTQAQDGQNIVIVNATALNLRSGPSAEYTSLGILRGGETYVVDGISPDYIWFHILDTAFGDGWVRGRHTIFRGDINSVKVISTGYGPIDTHSYVIVNATGLFLRTGPGVQYAILGELRGGQSYTVEGLSSDGIWFYVSGTPFGAGWLRGRYTIYRGNIRTVQSLDGPIGRLAPSYLFVHIFIPVYSSIDGRQLGLIPGRFEYLVTGRSLDGKWIQIQTPQFGKVWTQIVRGSFRGYYFNVPVIQ